MRVLLNVIISAGYTIVTKHSTLPAQDRTGFGGIAKNALAKLPFPPYKERPGSTMLRYRH